MALLLFFKAIPNTIDSAIRGDFKDDDGSYSDKVGKIIGGLNPAGDVRDIIADGKRVADGEKGGWIKLGATVISPIPIVGDGAKPIIKAEEKTILETLEKQRLKKAKKSLKKKLQKLAKKRLEKFLRQRLKTSFRVDLETLSNSINQIPTSKVLWKLMTQRLAFAEVL